MPADPESSAGMVVLPATATVKGAADRFTGDVWVDGITTGAGAGTPTLAAVHFAPGARTAWHCHASGQTLHVTDGRGVVVTRDGHSVRMRPGDTIFTPPGVWHWHGALPGSFMTHLALSLAGGEVQWGGQVTDDQYLAATDAKPGPPVDGS